LIILLRIILTIVIVILLTIGIVKLIDKFVPKKLKPVLNIALWVIIAVLAYMTFMSVYGEIQFNKLKVKRYELVIEKLKDIRDSELAYKTVNGKFTDNFEELVKFIDNGKYAITQRRDSTMLDKEKTKLFCGVETFKDIP